MPRTRNIYQTDRIFVGPTGSYSATGRLFESQIYNVPTGVGVNLIGQLHRIQNADWSFSKELTDVNQWGELAAIDRVPLTQPTVNASFTYLLSNLANEQNIGLFVGGGGKPVISAVSYVLSGTQDSKNYFFSRVAEGSDHVGGTVKDVIAIGNGFLSSYTFNAAVGEFPQATVNVEGLNMEFEVVDGTLILAATGLRTPAVNPVNGTELGWYYSIPTGVTQSLGGNTINDANDSLSVLRPGDISFNIGYADGGPNEADMKVQSVNVSFDLSRENLEKLGSKYAFAKVVSFPVTVSMSVVANLGDIDSGSLITLVDQNANYNPTVYLKKPGGTVDADIIAMYQLKTAKLDSQEYSMGIGDNKQVTLNFSTQLGGPEDTSKGLFLSGIYNPI